MTADAIAYSHLLLLDLTPLPKDSPCSCYTIKNSGIDEFYSGRIKMTRKLRMTPLRLHIFEDPHEYHLVAKVDSSCDSNAMTVACSAVNEHIRKAKRTGMSMKEAAMSVIDNFPPRVLKGFDFTEHNNPISKFGSSARVRNRMALLSSDTEGTQGVGSQGQDTQTPPPPPPIKKRPEPTPSNSDEDEDAREVSSKKAPKKKKLPKAKPVDKPSEVFKVPVTDSTPPPGATVIAPAPVNTTPLVLDGVIDLGLLNDSQLPVRSLSASSDDVQRVANKVESFQKSVSRQLETLQGSITYLCGRMETFNEEHLKLQQIVQQIADKAVADKLQEKEWFPLRNKADVEEYLLCDPNAQLAAERYTYIRTHICQTQMHAVLSALVNSTAILIIIKCSNISWKDLSATSPRSRGKAPTGYIYCCTYIILTLILALHVHLIFPYHIKHSFLPLFFFFSLLEVEYDERSYPTAMLLAIFTPRLIKLDYTYPGKFNTMSDKEKLPQPLVNAIETVARHRLVGKKLTFSKFIEKVKQRFSSWKLKVCSKTLVPFASLTHTYIHNLCTLDPLGRDEKAPEVLPKRSWRSQRHAASQFHPQQ